MEPGRASCIIQRLGLTYNKVCRLSILTVGRSIEICFESMESKVRTTLRFWIFANFHLLSSIHYWQFRERLHLRWNIIDHKACLVACINITNRRVFTGIHQRSGCDGYAWRECLQNLSTKYSTSSPCLMCTTRDSELAAKHNSPNSGCRGWYMRNVKEITVVSNSAASCICRSLACLPALSVRLIW